MGVHIPEGATQAIGRLGLVLKKHAPEILMGVGIIAVVGVAVTAVRATLKVEEVLDHHEEKIELIKNQTDISEEEKLQETVKVWAKTSSEMFILYLPTLTFGVLACTSFMTSHKIMRERQLAMIAAYKIMEYSYSQYRYSVRQDHGDEYDQNLRDDIAHAGHTSHIVVTTNEDGTSNAVAVKYDDPNDISVYARFFDETCPNWEPNAEYNLLFLQQQQSFWNDILKSRGHVFLNEVYEGLGIPHSSAGAICGWAISKEDRASKNSDNYIDFGIFRVGKERSRAFVNGYEKAILLDFNVQGVVYDLI